MVSFYPGSGRCDNDDFVEQAEENWRLDRERPRIQGNRSTARTADSKPANLGSNPSSPAISLCGLLYYDDVDLREYEYRGISREPMSSMNGVCCK